MSYVFARKFDLGQTPVRGVGAIKHAGAGALFSRDNKPLQLVAEVGMYAGMGYGVYLVLTGSLLTGALVFCGAPMLTLIGYVALTGEGFV